MLKLCRFVYINFARSDRENFARSGAKYVEMSLDYMYKILCVAFPDVPKEVGRTLNMIYPIRDQPTMCSFYEDMFVKVLRNAAVSPTALPFDVVREIMLELDDLDTILEFAKCSRLCASAYTHIMPEKLMEFDTVKYRGVNVTYSANFSLEPSGTATLADYSMIVNQRLPSGALLIIDETNFHYKKDHFTLSLTEEIIEAWSGFSYLRIACDKTIYRTETAFINNINICEEAAGDAWPLVKYLRGGVVGETNLFSEPHNCICRSNIGFP